MATPEPLDSTSGLLLRAAQALFGGHEPAELLHRFFGLVRQAVPCDSLELAVLLPSRRAARLLQIGPEGLLPAPHAALPLTGTSLGHVLAEACPYLSGDLAAGELRFPDEELCRSRGVARAALVPLGAPHRWLGTLRACRSAPQPFSPSEVAHLERLAEPFAQALEHSLQSEQLRRASARQRALLDLAAVASQARDLEVAFEAVCDTLGHVMSLDRAALYEIRGDEAHVAAARAAQPELAEPVPPFPWRGSHLEGAVARREPYLYRLGDVRLPHLEWLARRGLQSTVGAPVLSGGAVYGVLAAASRDPDAYSAEELELISRTGMLVGLVVENAFEREAAVRAAARERQLQDLQDSLSGLLDVQEICDALLAGLHRLCAFEWAAAYEVRNERLELLATDAPPEAHEYLSRSARVAELSYADLLRAGRPLRRERGQPGAEQGWSIRHGYGASLTLPVVVRGQATGVLGLTASSSEGFAPEEVELLLRAARQFGLALQSARAFAEVQRLAQRERDLLEITNALTSYHDARDVYPAMMQALQRLADFDSGTVFSVEGEWLRPITPAPLPEDAPGASPAVRWRDSDARGAIESRRPTRAALDEPDGGPVRLLHEAGLRAVAHVPVVGRDQVLAVFALGSHSPNALTPADLHLVARAAQQFGVALENARSHAENMRLAERERDLLELTNAMTLHRDPQDILQEMLPALGRLVRFDRSDMVAVFELDREVLRPVAVNLSQVRESEFWGPHRWAGLPVATLLATGSSRRVEVGALWEPVAARLAAAGFRVAALVPLVTHGGAVGMFWLASRHPDAFPPADMDTLKRVAQQFGLALEAGRGYMEIQQRGEKLELENRYLKEELSEVAGFEEIVGVGPALAQVREMVRKVARTDSVVLIRGESGTGKELVAEAVHRLGARAERPLIKVNCAALPESLISSELFGHEKGAFTGAFAQRLGRFELARGGTIFLDEIGELSLEVQSKLLRVLQEGEFERVGSSSTLKTDARVMAATNRDLEAAVAEGRFRQDLFYRLNVFPIHVPPLRQRPEDIPVLAYYFLHRHARRMNKNITRLAPDSEARMVAYSWPGNIRELQNVIERAVILCDGEELRVDPALLTPGPARNGVAAPSPAAAQAPAPEAEEPGSLLEAERRHILAALRRAGGRIAGPSGAAALLGLKRTTLNSKIKKLGISRFDYLQ